MEFSPELYWNIVKNVGNRNDITTLCRVNKGFRHAAERALYNTLYLGTTEQIVTVCDTLARQSRLASLVDALTLQVSDMDDVDSDDEDDEVSREVTDRLYLPDQHWESISHCLQKTHSLRHFNVHINNGSRASNAWILRNTAFRLRSFHCDLNWDQDLVDFLNTQADLDDLFISDFDDSKCSDGSSSTTQTPPTCLDSNALPNLSRLECTFTEAATMIVPARPITHLKTCFSCSKIEEKRVEMNTLLAKVRLSTRPLRSLDIADSSYDEDFSMELLSAVVVPEVTTKNLRYLGTLVLPVAGREVRSISSLRPILL